MGFHGELHVAGTQWQILGNGYRVYSPALRRFHRPDSLSPFAEGGLNAYAAFQGDPINLADPSGHFAKFVLGAAVLAGTGALVGSAVAGTEGEGTTAGILAAVALGVGVAAAGGMHLLRASSRVNAVGVPPATPPVPTVQPGRTVRIGELRFASGAHGDELVAHGLPFATGSTGAVSGHALARQVSTAVGPGYRFKPINMLSCYSAVGGRHASQAQRLANTLKVPVRGYRGRTHGMQARNSNAGPDDHISTVFRPQTGVARRVTSVLNTALHPVGRGMRVVARAAHAVRSR
ncbi:RHS repeat-associated core domain-containing protein [Stenotrophomonas sp. NPDC077464]|uniref:RHS repeat-associated core domain-containing protein n=1 Tax=unclassified Stenotrophomonas TaxID=196198 RepID=UPI0037D0B8B1